MRSKFVRFQLRDLLFIALPALLIVIGVIWFALRFVNPAPPGTLVLSAATSGSPYYRYAERYQATFERNGVKLEIRESGGSLANLKALSNSASGVDAGFVQGGLASNTSAPGLLSVGRIAYEPLWIFYTGNARLERLTDLKGKRILVGPAGSGTNGLALRLLSANGITSETATLINRELPDYVDLLAKGEADAGFLVLAPEAKTVQRLLRTPNIRLMSFMNADSYTQRFPSSTCWRNRSMTCMASRPSTRAAKHNCFRAPGRFRLPMIPNSLFPRKHDAFTAQARPSCSATSHSGLPPRSTG